MYMIIFIESMMCFTFPVGTSPSTRGQALVTARADPLGKGPKGVTALHRAVMEGHEEVGPGPVGQSRMVESL